MDGRERLVRSNTNHEQELEMKVQGERERVVMFRMPINWSGTNEKCWMVNGEW